MEQAPLAGSTAVVTGASAGIGRAVAVELARRGASVWLLGRRLAALETVAAEIAGIGRGAFPWAVDLGNDADVARLVERLDAAGAAVDILVHSAAVYAVGTLGDTPVGEMDVQYRVNVRAPYLLTQLLLPKLRARRGQVVFINSSVGMRTRAGIGPYAATKHALRALADTLREEVNAEGMRVLSVYVGRTATPGQAALHAQEGRSYHPDRLLQPGDVAAVIAQAVTMPPTAEVTEIHIRPANKP